MMLCAKCKSRPAVVFVTRMDGNESRNEGYCLRCAKEMNIGPVNQMLEKFGISDEDMEQMESQMSDMLAMAEEEGADEEGFSPGGAPSFPFLQNLFGGPRPEGAAPADGKTEKKKDKKQEKKRKFLDQYCTDLTAKAREGRMDPTIGRQREIYRVTQILSRRTKNNPCLIGEPGVGKTAIAEGLADRIARGQVPPRLLDKEVHLLDLTALVAGTQFRGQFESRIKGLVDEVRAAGNIILFIDEVHNLVGTGDAEGSMSAANILKPALSRGEIQVIGATTFNEYRKHIEKDTALERRFQPVTVNEPSIEDSVKILQGLAPNYEKYHGVKISEGIIRQAVVLSERYITDRFLPDKAIDLIDEACSDLNLKDADINRLLEVRQDLENVTFERETLMSADPEGADMDERYARIAELRSQEMRLQQELEELEETGVLSHEETEQIRNMGEKPVPPSVEMQEKTRKLPVEPKEMLFATNRELSPFGDGEQWKCLSLEEMTLLSQIPLKWQKEFFFLLPYRKYHHLILQEKADGIWLGLPNHYNEADAADAETFGFGTFRRVDDDWGYWMCFLERNS